MVLTKTIVETICQGGSIVFETKTYSGEFCETYMVRPTEAAFVEVDCPAWPPVFYTPGSSSGTYGAGYSYGGSSGSSISDDQSEVGWYFDAGGNRYYGYSDDGYDFVVVEEYYLIQAGSNNRHIIWVDECVTTVDRPGTVIINDIQIHIRVAPATITYSTTSTSVATVTRTATAISGLSAPGPSFPPRSGAPSASPSAVLDPDSNLNSTSFNSTNIDNGTVSDRMRLKLH